MTTTATVFGDGIITGGTITGTDCANLTVSSCMARFGGREIVRSSQAVAVFPPGPSLPRIDLIVMGGSGEVVVLEGAEAAAPVAPEAPTGMIPLATATLTPGTSVPTLTDVRTRIVTGPVAFNADGTLAMWTVTELFTIEAAALRTLNSLPIALVTPPTATSMVVPLSCFQLIKGGTVPFSAELHLLLNLPANGGCGNFAILETFQTSSRAAHFDLGDTSAYSGSDYVLNGGIGEPLFLAEDNADRTGGDGTVLTLLLTYQIAETAGRI